MYNIIVEKCTRALKGESMKSFIRTIFSLLLFVIFICSFGCGEEKPVDNPPKENEEDKVIDSIDIVNAKDIEEGETLELAAVYDVNIKVELVWVSSNDEIATVVNGKVTGIKKGTVAITVTDNISKLSKAVEIEVKAKKIALSEDEAEEFFKSLPKQTNNNLPNKCKDIDVTYEFSSHISKNGVITRDEENYNASGKVYIGEYSYDYNVVVVGEFIDDLAQEFIKQFKNINGSLVINKRYDDYGGTVVTWSCDSDIISKLGEYSRPFNNTYITINYTVVTKDPAARATYSTQVLALGESKEVRDKTIEAWINTVVKENSVLYKESVLPEYSDEYNVKIEWLDDEGKKVDLEKYADDPVLGKTAVFTVKVTYPNVSTPSVFTMDYRVWNKRYNSVEEKAQDFVDAIYKEKIRSYVYWSQGYDEVNMGYVPFYDSKESVINTDYMCEYTYGYVCTGILKKSTEYITIHDTAGASPTHTALQFAQGQVQKNTNKQNTEYISWHFTVGTDGIYQSLPLDEVAYHAGDGSREYGTIWYSSTYNKSDCIGGGNRNSIGIESCINHGTDYNDTMRILAKLVAELLLQYNLSVDRIKQHWHFSGKDCPGVIRHCKRWDEFLDLVRLEYFAKTELKDVQFEWTSLTPSILDNTGHVLQSDGNEFTISYKVKCTVGETSFEKEYTSTILEQYKINLGDWN